MPKYQVYATAMGSVVVEAIDQWEAVSKACNCDIEDFELQWGYETEELKTEAE